MVVAAAISSKLILPNDFLEFYTERTSLDFVWLKLLHTNLIVQVSSLILQFLILKIMKNSIFNFRFMCQINLIKLI